MLALKRVFALLLLLSLHVIGAADELTDGRSDVGTSQVLYLHTEFIPYQHEAERVLQLRLMREFARQAFLIAAREELGIPTRDGTLRESEPGDENGVHLALLERLGTDGKWHLKLFALNEGKQRRATRGLWIESPLWEKTFDYALVQNTMYAETSSMLEHASRGEFVDALLAAGLKKSTRDKQKDDAPKPTFDAWNEQLAKLDFVTQYGVVQSAHEAMRSQDDRAAILGVLARGYANLSMLTQHQWNAVGEVFASRAILYAQRMVTETDQNATALWHRAYVWAVIGAHQHALADIRQIRKAVTETGDTETNEPAWGKLIDVYLKCDRAAMSQFADANKEQRAWALRLAFQLASSYRYSPWMYHAARELAQQAPTCFGVYAELVTHGGSLAAERTGASHAPMVFAQFLPTSLTNLSGFPDVAREAIKQPANVVNVDNPATSPASRVAKVLREVSRSESSPEISWSTLAYLLEEEQFVQAANLLDASMDAVESSHAEMVDSLLPIIGDHRYRAYIESFRYGKRFELTQMRNALKELDIEDPRKNMSRMILTSVGVVDGSGKDIGKVAWQHSYRNFTFQGLLEEAFFNGTEWKPSTKKKADMLSWELGKVAPRSEVARRMDILKSEEPARKQLERWERRLNEDPIAYSELGKHYERLEDTENAIRCYKKSLDSLPTLTATRGLANLYFVQDDFAKGKQTLEDFLQTEDLGLSHARINEDLAWRLVGRGQWDEAKPHALEAAESWSSWGLRVASYVLEGLAQWEDSERFIRQRSQSYPSSAGYEWYFWCARTGRGNIQPSQQLARKYFAASDQSPTRVRHIKRGAFHLLEGNDSAALDAYQLALEVRPTLTCTFMVAQISERNGDKQTAKKVSENMRFAIAALEEPLRDIDIVGLDILDVIDTGEVTPAKLDEIDGRLLQINGPTRCAFTYFLAVELDQQNMSEKGGRILAKSTQ
ncbi:tetratricopeptide repeat protein [Neorhodopirellula lusitana]|uniref:tetratricopeptide repeat protein n=1 Tax=Neorhodopirellula lusitana TaxID=445327 RepID=UPI00384D5C76